MKVQGLIMQARFIEIYQVFAKKKKVGYFSNEVVWEKYPQMSASRKETEAHCEHYLFYLQCGIMLLDRITYLKTDVMQFDTNNRYCSENFYK